jgi:hypothetical protein
MSSNPIKLRLEGKVHYLLLRYPNNLDRVAAEASKYMGSEVTVEMVTKIKRRFRQKQDKDVRFWVSCSMSQLMIQGTQERLAKLEAMYEHWDGLEDLQVSSCCEYPVEKHEDVSENVYFRCLKCHETCKTRTMHRDHVEKLKIRLIQEMRKESDHVMKYAKTMGFISNAGDPEIPPVVHKNFVYVDAKQGESKGPVQLPISAEEAKKVEDMEPMERTQLTRKLEALLEESKSEEVQGDLSE